MPGPTRDPYLLTTLAKGLAALRLVESFARPTTTTEIASAMGLNRVGVLRLLHTLEREGYLRRDAGRRYCAVQRRKAARIGYCAPLTGTRFRRTVAESLQKAAADAELGLTVLDNPEDDPATAIHNAEFLVELGVGAAILFQPQQRVAHGLADVLQRAAIPFISIDSPIPGGFYFGANNYEAGRLAGRTLGAFARRQWQGRCHRVVLLEAHLASQPVEARFSGALVGLREILPGFPESRVHHVDGQGHRDTSFRIIKEVLQGQRPGAKILISCFNDPAAIGALDAVRELGREREVAIVGQNATAEVHRELADPTSPLIASVAYFAERYGERLVDMCQKLIRREAVPPAVLVEHTVLTRENWRRYYPAAKPLDRSPRP